MELVTKLLHSFALVLFCSLALPAKPVHAWGPEGHYWLTARAIDSLEGRLKEFYSEQSASIIEHSVDADYRKSKDPEERFRHYVDLDRYGFVPFRGFDLDYDVLVKKHGSDQVQKNGLVLWTAEKTFRDLVNAFKTKNREEIVRNSSDLAHYIGDLHQPLSYRRELQRSIHRPTRHSLSI